MEKSRPYNVKRKRQRRLGSRSVVSSSLQIISNPSQRTRINQETVHGHRANLHSLE